MKTRIEIPNELFREAKARAALEGCTLKDFVTEGLRLRLRQSRKQTFVKFPLIKSRRKGRKRLLNIPDDIAARAELMDDLKRYDASCT
jgi:hypothetical protein